jgi:hypothetical protein
VYNGLQAGTVCSLKLFLPKCLFKDTNVCCFCKNKKMSTAEKFAKAITSSMQIVLACCYLLALMSVEI